jgi:hypothetical protein
VQGIDTDAWIDTVEQLAIVDRARELDPIIASIAAYERMSHAWTAYRRVTQQLLVAVTGLQDGSIAYNAIIAFVRTNSALGAALAYNAALKSSARAFTGVLLADVAASRRFNALQTMASA